MKKILFGLIALIGLCGINFSSAGNFEGFNLVSSAHFNSTNYNTITENSSTIYYNFSTGGIYCGVIENLSISNSYSNSLSDVALFLLAGLDYRLGSVQYVGIRLGLNYFGEINNVNFNNPVICTSYANLGTSRGFRFYKTSNLDNLFTNYNLSFDVNIYYYGNFDLFASSCQSSSCDYSGYILETNVTENYCTNKFSNLIDESDITSGYCETEFGLIDPENCPSSGGTGDILWSSFWVNDRQIEGASNIYLYMPDFLSWDYTYLNSGATLQIDVDNEGDQDYINKLLTIETYHPSSDEFAVSFVGYLTLLMPYIVITLFIAFIWKLIKRVFK